MIYGIGTDIVEVKRFLNWVQNSKIIDRYFNKEEQCSFTNQQAVCEHYAARFAAKEAFGKALGIGLAGLSLSDVYIAKDKNGKPEIKVKGTAETLLNQFCGECKVHVSLTHEREYAVAYVIIEKI